MSRFLELLLLLYPRPFRKRYGREMLDQLRADLDEARAAGGAAGLAGRARHLGDFLVSGVRERLRRLQRTRRKWSASPGSAAAGNVEDRRAVVAVLRDLKHALRGLRRRPAFTLSAVVILGLGLTLNVSVLSMAMGVLRPEVAGVDDDGPLVSLLQFNVEQGYFSSLSLPTWGDYQDRLDGLESLAAHSQTSVNLVQPDGSRRLEAALVSPDYFRTLGVGAEKGRTLGVPAGEGDRGSVVLSHALWRGVFGGRLDILGRTIRLNDVPFTVVGIAPEAFRGLDLAHPVDVWIPLEAWPDVTTYQERWVRGRGMHWLGSVGRLAPGVTREQVKAEAESLAAALAEEHPETQAGWDVRVLPLREALIWPGQRREVRRVAFTLGAVAVLILLLTCVTLASMALADVVARRNEAAVRLALGAGRGHLVRDQLARALLIVLPALAVGLLVGDVVVRTAEAWSLVPELPAGLDVRPDRRVALMALVVAPILAALVAVLPALQVGSDGPGPALARRDGGSGRRVGRLRRALSALQVGISVAVLAVSGSLTRSALAQLSHELGFDPSGVLLASMDLQTSGYDDEAQRIFVDRGRQALGRLPGVHSAAVAAFVPFSGPRLGADVTWTDPGGARRTTNVTGNIVTPGYFRTLRIPVVEGRGFDEELLPGPVPVVVNRTAARAFWGETTALGRSLELGEWFGGEGVVIGVVGDLGAGRTLLPEARPSIFLDLRAVPWGNVTFHVRAADGPAAALVADVRRVLGALDPAVPVHDVTTLRSEARRATAPAVAIAGAVGMLGLLGLLLAAAGIYGVVAQAVARRRREFGVRVAVGAARTHVLGYVLREGAVVLALGVALGVPGALALSRLVEGRLFGVDAADPATLIGAVLLTVLATAAALVLPAHRATSVDPAEALRAE